MVIWIYYRYANYGEYGYMDLLTVWQIMENMVTCLSML